MRSEYFRWTSIMSGSEGFIFVFRERVRSDHLGLFCWRSEVNFDIWEEKELIWERTADKRRD